MQRNLLAIGLLVWTNLACAEIVVEAWSRATPPGGSSGAIYGNFTNSGTDPVTLESAQVDFARHVMVHETRHDDGMARMQHASLVIPANGTATLKPGGLHIMLMGMTQRLMQGCRYPIELSWSDGTVTQHQFLTGTFGQLTAPEPESLESCQ